MSGLVPFFVHYLMGKDSNTIASIHHLFKRVPIQVAQHLKTHCTQDQLPTYHDAHKITYESANTNRKSNLVLCSCTEIKQSVSRSEAKCRNSNKLNRYPCLNRGKKGINYWLIKEDETCGHKNGNPANP